MSSQCQCTAKKQSSITSVVVHAFLCLAALFVFIAYADTPHFKTFAIIFVSISFEAIPFMLVGAVVGGIIEVFVPYQLVVRLLPKQKGISIFIATALGLVFPTCECAIIPIVRRLLRKGMPLGAAIGYLLAGPILNPIVFVSTYVAYRYQYPQMAVLRICCAYIIAVACAFLVQLIYKGDAPLVDLSHSAHEHHHHTDSFSQKIKAIFMHAGYDFFSVGKYLMLGAAIAAAMQTFIPRIFLKEILNQGFISGLGMMLLSFILSLCSEADAFVAASFNAMAVPISAQLVFLVFGPMCDIKLMLMYSKIFRVKMIIVFTTLVIILNLAMLALVSMVMS